MAGGNGPQIIVALDNIELEQVDSIVTELSEVGIQWFKVGLELYLKGGNPLLEKLKSKNFKIFLDLKFHDIPNTVHKAVAAAVKQNVELITVHASGGFEMISLAAKATQETKSKLIAVTVLTSDDQPSRMENAEKLAKLSFEAGAHGIVSSVSDLRGSSIKNIFSGRKDAIFVTPGIRSAEDSKNDQSSIATAEEAVDAGATHLVIGRPILQPRSGMTRAKSAAEFLKKLKRN